MRTLDWIVLACTLLSIILYGIYKGKGSRSLSSYLLADRNMRWYTVALSIMATQASAVTFTSTAVPIFRKLGVFTAYEYLEHRFDLRTRTLTALIFLVQRGLSVGITIYAPSLVLSVMLGWDIRWTSTAIGGAIIIYTTFGGVKAVNWTDVQQMLIILSGMIIAFVMTIALLPKGIGFVDALRVAGGMGKLNAVDFSFDLHNRYNFWSGLVGGTFVALAYFGTDQSQVQRYLTGASIRQSRLGLIFNGIAKVPMQFFILLLGAMVFVFFQFERPPLFFNPVEVEKVSRSFYGDEFRSVERRYAEVSSRKAEAVRSYVEAKRGGDAKLIEDAASKLRSLSSEAELVRNEGIAVLRENDPSVDPSDTNYIFLTFVIKYLPVGLVGLLFACIFAASMSSTSGELSALATCTVVDIYKRHIANDGDDRHYLRVSRFSMALWGVYAIVFAQYASRLGSLIEAVNILGSLFYGTMLAIFLIALYVKRIGGTAVFWGAIAGEAAVLWCYAFTTIPWLWYNVIGCGVVVASASLIQILISGRVTPASP